MAEIPGLSVIYDAITHEEEKYLLDFINATERSWNSDLVRRTQHYGYHYNYGYPNKRLSEAAPIPAEFMPILKKFNSDANQVIVNEYKPGQGIAAHTDAKIFDDVVTSLSLGSSCRFNFIRGNEFKSIFLPPRTLVRMTGDARWLWKHEIGAKKTDKNNDGQTIKRGTRVSLTMRRYR